MRRLYLLAASFVLAMLAVWLLIPGQALAQDLAPTAHPPVVGEVLTEVIKIVGAVVLLLAGWVVKKLETAFTAKTGIDVSSKEEALVNDWVAQGVHFAEERALQWSKEHASKPLPGQKLEWAFDFVWDQINEAGFVGWARDLVLAKINGVVGANRE